GVTRNRVCSRGAPGSKSRVTPRNLRARQPPRRDPETEGPSEPLPRSGLQPPWAGDPSPRSGEIRPADLAARRSGKRGHDPEVARRLEPGEVVATVLTQLLERRRIVRARRHDPRRHVLAPLGLRPARPGD